MFVMSNKFEEYDDTALYDLLKNQNSDSEKAFSILYDRHSQRLLAYCKRFLNDREAAEDVFQETFIRFYQSGRKDKIMTNVPAFLIKIARNLCLNHRRDEVYHLSYEDYLVDPYIYGDDSNTQDLIKTVRYAVEQLPNDYKEPFVLREYEGLSYPEIAEITGESITNIKVRIHRAKLKVREMVLSLELDSVKVVKEDIVLKDGL